MLHFVFRMGALVGELNGADEIVDFIRLFCRFKKEFLRFY